MALFNRASRTPDDSESASDNAPKLLEAPPVDDEGRRSLDDHRDYLLSMVEPLAPFGMSLIDAWGHTLCEDIKGYSDLPPVPVAEVDGYAFCAADVATVPPGSQAILSLAGRPRRAVTADDEKASDETAKDSNKEPKTKTPETAKPAAAESNAESPANSSGGAIGVGQAMRVRSGEKLPEGADTVVAHWQVEPDKTGTRIAILTKITEGDWVRPVGAEARDGQLLMPAGLVLDDRRSALLAAAGFDRVMARPRTRVVLVQVSDSEKEPPFDGGRAPTTGIHLINGAAKSDGATVWRIDADLASLQTARERLNDELIRADLVLTVGGLTDDSADPRLLRMLGEMGVVEVAEVALRPGRRHGFGLIGDDHTPVVMLPGDPTALLVAYHAFARPVLRKLMGVEPYAHEPVLCFAERDFDAELGLTQLVPCRLRQDGNRFLAVEVMSRRHSLLSALVAADALVVLPPNRQRVYAGEALACWLLGDQLAAVE